MNNDNIQVNKGYERIFIISQGDIGKFIRSINAFHDAKIIKYRCILYNFEVDKFSVVLEFTTGEMYKLFHNALCPFITMEVT